MTVEELLTTLDLGVGLVALRQLVALARRVRALEEQANEKRAPLKVAA